MKTNLGKLLSASSKIIIANLVEIGLFGFSIEGIALRVDDLRLVQANECQTHGIRGDDLQISECSSEQTYTIRRWINLDNLEIDGPHSTSNLENVSFAHRSVSFEKVWAKVNIKEVTRETFHEPLPAYISPSTESANGRTCILWVSFGHDTMYDIPLSVFDVIGWRDMNEIAQLDGTIASSD